MKYKTICILAGLSISPLFAADVTVTGDITSNTTWTADNTYIIEKPIFITGGATLTIEPGTLILGDENTTEGTFGSLIATRGSQLIADGTADKPIVFTARAERDGIAGDPSEKPDPALGDASFWGGVILLGNAQVNKITGSTNDGEARIEGFPVEANTTNTTYGGGATPNNADSSGILRYVSIRFGGFQFAANNEINGLTLGGVGSGTIIENVEVISNSDDGVEFFGGTVNTKRIAVAFCQDESFDIDQGHSGFHQFWFSIQSDDPALGDFGGEWDGGNGDNVNLAPFTLTKIYNMTMLGTGSTASGSIDDGINLSDNFAGTLANSVIHDFNGAALTTQSDGVNSPKPNFLNNTWGVFGGGAGIVPNIGGAGATDPAGFGNSAVGTDPLLRGISRTPNGGLDPRPANNSPLLGATLADFPSDAPPGFFEAVDYRGAFETAESCNWLRGWSYLSQAGYLGSEDVNVTADITSNTTWTADKTYIIEKPIFITGGATLTIEPGTLILGDENTTEGTFGSLIATRGSQLIADGTADKPIVFTARAERDGIAGDPSEKPDPALGDASFWGGVILLGNAQVNKITGSTNDGEARIEGFPVEANTTNTTYGGGATPNNADSSGILRYVSIRFGGFQFAANNEINGLTLGGVGSGTIIENVEVISNSDDGVEFFGGTVNTKRIAVAFCQDESFDIDQGHSGFHQFWFSIQSDDPALGDFGGEWDGGNGDNVNLAPFTLTKIYNMTMLGTGSTASGSIDDGINLSDNFAGTLANSVIHDFNGAALTTQSDGVNSPKPNFLNNTWGVFGGGAGIVPNIGGAGATDPAGFGNSSVGTDPMLVGISRVPNRSLDPRPQLGSPLYSSTLSGFPTDAPAGFFTEVEYRGAFGGNNWLNGWSYLSKAGYLSGLPDADASGTTGGNSGGGDLTDTDGDGISDDLENTAALIALGFNAAVNNVSPTNLFSDIYTSSSIVDLSADDIVVQKTGNTATLNIPVESSVNLVPPFTPVGNATITIPNVPVDKEFYRFRIPSAD
ncbi:MAG: hypothetical protein NWQ16_13070 [Akkermansiaceae bacterium]|nr:hypothetical protein [Akkermansiaceae bacterium]